VASARRPDPCAQCLSAPRDYLRRQQRDRIQKSSGVAMAMLDGSPEDDRLLIRGSSSNPGKIIPRRYLQAIAGREGGGSTTGSGRMRLADQICDPGNPLTTRVIVNRVWHYLLGRGIVPTADDFGVLGQPPTHPGLLDYLAREFQADGQSLKRLIRRIVLSRVYRMSGRIDPEAAQRDPDNQLWHHRPPRRLEGEAIRDALLSISGRLDPSMHGEPIPVHLTSFMDGRGKPSRSGPIDGDGRRSIYVSVRRNFLSPFMLAFDTPVPQSTMGRRNRSNVPAQSLILMNDPFVAQMAKAWAERCQRELPELSHSASGDQGSVTLRRIDWLYRSALGRSPTEAEASVSSRFVTETGDRSSVHQAWQQLAHSLIIAKEFRFLP
ncbi:MAG: DUF1553 domain-containing protein, partial [Planctomycetota bacterium]